MHPMPDHIARICSEFDRMTSEIALAISGTGLIPAQAIPLMHIGDSCMTATDLRIRGFYPGTNASYALQRLETLGYICRTKDKTDNRRHYIRLTKEGLKLCDRLRKELSREEASAEAA